MVHKIFIILYLTFNKFEGLVYRWYFTLNPKMKLKILKNIKYAINYFLYSWLNYLYYFNSAIY